MTPDTASAIARRILLRSCPSCVRLGGLCDACRDHLEHREQVAA